MNHKPFDLQKALSGDKFARKHDLREPYEWHYFKADKSCLPICCIYDGEAMWFSTTSKELVMLPKTKKLWLAIELNPSKYDENVYHSTGAFESLERLKKCVSNLDGNYKIIEVEIEE